MPSGSGNQSSSSADDVFGTARGAARWRLAICHLIEDEQLDETGKGRFLAIDADILTMYLLPNWKTDKNDVPAAIERCMRLFDKDLRDALTSLADRVIRELIFHNRFREHTFVLPPHREELANVVRRYFRDVARGLSVGQNQVHHIAPELRKRIKYIANSKESEANRRKKLLDLIREHAIEVYDALLLDIRELRERIQALVASGILDPLRVSGLPVPEGIDPDELWFVPGGPREGEINDWFDRIRKHKGKEADSTTIRKDAEAVVFVLSVNACLKA
jgi:hypothetical protein